MRTKNYWILYAYYTDRYYYVFSYHIAINNRPSYYNGGSSILSSHLSNEPCEEFAVDLTPTYPVLFGRWPQRGFFLFACKMKILRNLPILGLETLTLFYQQTRSEIRILHVNSLNCHTSPRRERKWLFHNYPNFSIAGMLCPISGHKTKWRTTTKYYNFSLRSLFKCKQTFWK